MTIKLTRTHAIIAVVLCLLISGFYLFAGNSYMLASSDVKTKYAYDVNGNLPGEKFRIAAVEGAIPANYPSSTTILKDTFAEPKSPSADGTDQQRMVIKQVELSIVVNDTIETINTITNLANDTKGFVVSSETSQYEISTGKKYQSASITIRVPNEKLDSVVKQIKSSAVEVTKERTSGQDVTADYTDLKSQLGNLETAEKQLQEILKNNSKADEVLNTYKELVKVRGEIEVNKGRMKYYEESVALSSISISIIPSIASTPIQIGWRPEGTFKQAVELLIVTFQDVADFIIVFIIARLPFLIVFGIPAFFIGRWGWRKYQARKKPTSPA